MSRRKERNFVLIGMPGVGKSTIGVLLAKAVCRELIDTDLLIQSKEHRALQDIIDREGVAAFLKLEERYVIGLSKRKAVIATGGSIVYSDAAMKHLGRSGLICHLFLPLGLLEERLSNFHERGIVRRPDQRLADLYHERIQLYRSYAGLEIDCTGLGHEGVLSSLLARIEADVSGTG